MTKFVGRKTIPLSLDMKFHHIIAAACVLTAQCAIAVEISSSAGQLHSLIENRDINTLKISGAIDASDIDFINSELKSLTQLDLSEVSIAAYSGAALSNGRTAAQADALPEYGLVGSTVKLLQLPASMTAIGECALAGSAIESLTLPAGVTVIGNYVFKECTALKSVTLGEGTTAIGTAAFEGCQTLTEITLPASVITVADRAFAGCMELKAVTFGNGITTIGDGAFSNCAITVADMSRCPALTVIGDFAFAGCNELTSVALPASVTAIGRGVFFDDTALTNAAVPDKVTAVPDFAFKGTVSVNSPTLLHNSVDHIGSHALYGHSKTEQFTMPATISYIGDRAMAGWESLKSLNVENVTSVPGLGNNVWGDLDCSNIGLYVPDNMRDTYAATPQWNEFDIRVNSGTGVTEILDDTAAGVTVRFAGYEMIVTSARAMDSIRLYDLSGRMVTETAADGVYQLTIDTTGCDTRFYIAEVMLNDGTRSVHKTVRNR